MFQVARGTIKRGTFLSRRETCSLCILAYTYSNLPLFTAVCNQADILTIVFPIISSLFCILYELLYPLWLVSVTTCVLYERLRQSGENAVASAGYIPSGACAGVFLIDLFGEIPFDACLGSPSLIDRLRYTRHVSKLTRTF